MRVKNKFEKSLITLSSILFISVLVLAMKTQGENKSIARVKAELEQLIASTSQTQKEQATQSNQTPALIVPEPAPVVTPAPTPAPAPVVATPAPKKVITPAPAPAPVVVTPPKVTKTS